MRLTLGTRGSALARTQSQWVADRFMATHSHVSVRLELIRTLGDAVQDRPLDALGRTGVFTAELERALLDGAVDFAVHSLKDLPVLGPPDLLIAAIPPREDPRDALVMPRSATFALMRSVAEALSAALPQGARVGTCSLRRRAQLRHARPDLAFLDLRGNVDTRLFKLDAGEYDACIFAAAGLKRLGLANRITWSLPPSLCMPDPGQGALAVQIRADRDDLRNLLACLNDPVTGACVTSERATLATMGGGCSTPLGALAIEIEPGRLHLKATVADPEGRALLRAEGTGNASDPESLGRQVANLLKAQGAMSLLVAPEREDGEKG